MLFHLNLDTVQKNKTSFGEVIPPEIKPDENLAENAEK